MASVKSLLDALLGARSSISDLEREIAALTAERAAVDALPPDAASFKAWVRRGLDTADAAYLERVRRHWCPETLAALPGSYVSDDAQGAVLLATKSHRADRGGGSSEFLGMARGLSDSTIPADLVALTYFLRPAIEARLDHLVDQAFPELRALSGIGDSERRARLAAIDKRLDTLTRERDELLAELDAVRAA